MDDYPVLDRGPILKANEAIGVRLQSASDSYMRAVVLEAEKELRARQMAREHGGTADDYRENEDVLGQADFDTKRALFHDRDNITRAVTMWRDAADQVPYVPPLGSFLVPFAATPTKIAQRGVEMALGPFGGIVSDLGTPDNVREKVDTDPEKWGRRLLGAGAWAFAMFLAALHDDEDGLPFITGTQDMYGKGDFQDRTAPAQSIRTPWGTYVSYRYAEPGSTGMATLIDTFRADKPAAEWMASTMTAIKDKSFFQSLERISKAAMDYANGKEAGISRLARETLWSPMFPNALKQPVRAADENRRLEFGNFLEPRDLAYAALPLETWAPPLKYDRWGREVTKGGAAWSASYLGWLTNWLSPVPVTRDIAEIEPIDIKLAHYYETNKKPGMRDAPDRGDMTEEEYADFTRLAGGRSLEILRPWVAQKATLTERDVEHIHDVENRVRKQVRAQIERNRR